MAERPSAGKSGDHNNVPSTSGQGGGNPLQAVQEFGIKAVDSVLDLILGPATEEQLRFGDAATQQVLQRKKRKPRKADPIPVDFNLRVRREAQAIVDRQKKQEEAERKAARRRAAAKAATAADLVSLALVQAVQLYSTSQACMLCVFVPQKCPELNASQIDSPLFTYTQNEPDGHLCAMKENLDWSLNSHFNNAVLVFNLVTLLVVLAATGYFWQREVYIVSHLVPKPELPYNHLPTIYDAYPAIKRNVLDMNTGAFLFASFMTFCIVCNIIISSVFLFYGDGQYNYNLGSRTITTTITNLMLISSRITGYFSYARMSYRNHWAISMFNVVPLSFNTIDTVYR